MATTTTAQGKPAAARKAAAASRKQSPSEKKGGKPLQFSFHTMMKPRRVYALTVEVPKTKQGASGAATGTVVVRAVVPGALVTPAEQRLDTSTGGNRVIFHVTPLARGSLPRAHVEVFTPGQALQEVRLPMKAKTQRLAWALFALAILLPWFMIKVTSGDWRPTRPRSALSGGSALAANVKDALTKNLFKREIPIINKPVEGLPGGLNTFSLANSLPRLSENLYIGLEVGVEEQRWAPVTAVIFFLLAFVSWMFHRPRRTRLKRSLDLGPPPESPEPLGIGPL
jgi:hypothetical protein